MAELEITKARKGFAEAVNRVAYGHERILLRRRGKEVAAIVPVEDLQLLEQLEDRIDLEEARKALADPERIPYEQIRRELGLSKE